MNAAALALIIVGLALASLTVWIVILIRLAAGQPIVMPDPRRDVPWQWLDVALVLGPLVGLSMVGLFAQQLGLTSGAREVKPQDAEAARDWVPVLLADAAVKLTLIGLAVMLGVVRWRASAADFGLTNRNIGRDLTFGVLGFLASLLPVYCVQALMIQASPPDKQHPVLQVLAQESDAAALVLAVIVAVVFAPLAEEFLFRAFLQGWLEAAFRSAAHSLPPVAPPLPVTDLEPLTVLEPAAFENPYMPPRAIPAWQPPDEQPPEATNGLATPAYAPVHPAWAAIMISSFVFAAMHASDWPAPVPLFLLALVLGYLYNHTHHLLPCIVVHLLFNGLSVAVVLSGIGPK